MPRKKKGLQVTKEQLRTTFAILRSQIRLGDDELRLRAIHEFRRELNCLWHEEIDKRAQAKGTTYETERDLIDQEAETWTAETPRTTS